MPNSIQNFVSWAAKIYNNLVNLVSSSNLLNFIVTSSHVCLMNIQGMVSVVLENCFFISSITSTKAFVYFNYNLCLDGPMSRVPPVYKASSPQSLV